MIQTYTAILNGDRLEWTGEAPPSGRSLKVEVTVLDEPSEEGGWGEERRGRMLEALERLAARGTFAHIDDAADWQREIRQDRPLSGRE